MTQTIAIWAGWRWRESWAHSQALHPLGSLLIVGGGGIMSQCEFGLNKQATLGWQPEGIDCIGLLSLSSCCASLVSVPPSSAPTAYHTQSLVSTRPVCLCELGTHCLKVKRRVLSSWWHNVYTACVTLEKQLLVQRDVQLPREAGWPPDRASRWMLLLQRPFSVNCRGYVWTGLRRDDTFAGRWWRKRQNLKTWNTLVRLENMTA